MLRRYKGKPCNLSIIANVIPVRISSRRGRKTRLKPLYSCRNLSCVNLIRKEPSKPRHIPPCLVLNARWIVKLDVYSALYAELKGNNIDVCCIFETWLNSTIPSSLICPPDFCIIRKDRLDNRGGKVVIVWRNDWRLQKITNMDNPFEYLWVTIEPVTPILMSHAVLVNHPPDHITMQMTL